MDTEFKTYSRSNQFLSKLLGHKTIQATQIYAKIVDEKKKEAMELLPTIEWENHSAENAFKIEKKV